MTNQDPWEPTFPAGYTLSPETAYKGGVSMCPNQGPAYPERWPTSETLAAPISEATAANAAPTLKEELARRSSGSRGIGGGTGRGGGSLSRRSEGLGGGEK